MAKERDWVDYSNLASNLYQNVQLNGIQDKLSRIASAAEIEQAKAELEGKYREVVFQADTHLRKLRTFQIEDKIGAFALASISLENFKRYNVQTSQLRNYEDKERLRSVVEGFEEVIEKCGATMSVAERNEAELCVDYFINPDIERFVPVRLKEQLAEKERELSLLAVKSEDASLMQRVCMGFMFVLIVGMFCEALFVDTLKISPETLTETGYFVVGISGILGCVICIDYWKHKRDPKRIAQKSENEKSAKLRKEELCILNQKLADAKHAIEAKRNAIMNKILKKHLADLLS